MNTGVGLTLILIAANVIVSINGFRDGTFFEKFKFNVGSILRDKQWYRMITSGFLHGSPGHLFGNMISLWFAGEFLEMIFTLSSLNFALGRIEYLILYVLSLLGGNFLALWLNRNNPSYSAIGASGAVSGLLFALAAIHPFGMLRLFFFIPMPLWLFALLYVGYSLWGMRSKRDNIGHEAHLGGAMIGMLCAFAFWPNALIENWYMALILFVPTGIFLYLLHNNPMIIQDPSLIFKGKGSMGSFGRKKGPRVVHYKEKGLEISTRKEMETELNELLDKVNRKGYDKLSSDEKARLDLLSKSLNEKDGPGHRAPRV